MKQHIDVRIEWDDCLGMDFEGIKEVFLNGIRADRHNKYTVTELPPVNGKADVMKMFHDEFHLSNIPILRFENWLEVVVQPFIDTLQRQAPPEDSPFYTGKRRGKEIAKDELIERQSEKLSWDEAVELLADRAHEAWSGWMQYLFDKCRLDIHGELIMPKNWRDRWFRQMTTKYKNLSEEEKESDRKEARIYMNLLGWKKPEERRKEMNEIGETLIVEDVCQIMGMGVSTAIISMKKWIKAGKIRGFKTKKKNGRMNHNL